MSESDDQFALWWGHYANGLDYDSAKQAWRAAIEWAGDVIRSEEELDGDMPAFVREYCERHGQEAMLRLTVRATKKSLLNKLRPD